MGFIKFFCLAILAQIAVCQRIEIDTWEDLTSTSGWTAACDARTNYQANITDFQCHNRIVPTIPSNELAGETGFWTGCQGTCLLTYTLRSNDEGFGFRAYLKDTHAIVIKNNLVWEYIPGNKWTEVNIDLSFTTTIGIYLPEITQTSFVMLDKIFITPEVATTTASPSTTISPNSTTLSPNTTTLAPNTTTLAPNTTTLAPNTTTLAPNTTTLSPNSTTTLSPNSTTLPILPEHSQPSFFSRLFGF